MPNRWSTPLGTFLVVCSCASPPPEIVQELAPVMATRFVYADGEAQYEYTSHRIMRQEVAGQTTRNETALRFRFSTTIAQNGADRTVQLVVDSVVEATGPGFTQSMIRSVSGLRLGGSFGNTGAVTSVVDGGTPSPLRASLTTLMITFFPRIPDGGAEAGSEWTDTTEVKTNDGSTEITKRSVVYSTAGQWSEDGSQLPITWRSDYTLNGAGQQMGQNFTLTGTGQTQGEHLLSVDGVFLGMALRDSSEAEVMLPAIGIAVPIVQAVVDSVRILR